MLGRATLLIMEALAEAGVRPGEAVFAAGTIGTQWGAYGHVQPGPARPNEAGYR